MINTEAWQGAQAAFEELGMEEPQAAPQQATDDTQASTTEVHDEPVMPQQQGNVEDTAPQAAPQEQQGITVEEYDPDFVPDKDPNMSDDWEKPDPRVFPEDFNPEDEILPDGEPDEPGFVPDKDPNMPDHSGYTDTSGGLDMDGDGIDDMSYEEYDEMVSQGDAGFSMEDYWEELEEIWAGTSDSDPSDSEVVSMPTDKIVDPAPTDQVEGLPGESGEEDGDATAGGYDGSGIAGGLDIDYDDTDFGDESDKGSADVISEQEASEAQSNFTEAEYQEVLDDLDNGNIEDVREFLEDLAHGGNDDTQEAQDAPGDHEHGNHFVDEGISIGDIVGEENVQEDFEDANNSTEEYIYDEDAYEDAEDALEDLQDALQDGDEEDLAEALEELQGYLGGFDKADDEYKDGTEAQDDQIPSVSEEDSDTVTIQDFVDLDSNGTDDRKEDSDGDGIWNWFDSESDGNGTVEGPVDAPDASGAAVSGAAVGETGGLGDLDLSDVFGFFGGGSGEAAGGSGSVGEAIDAATQLAGGAIDGALGIEGSGKILDDVLNGDFDEALEGIGEEVVDFFDDFDNPFW